jgi:hypothetical protein
VAVDAIQKSYRRKIRQLQAGFIPDVFLALGKGRSAAQKQHRRGRYSAQLRSA